jgi:hypothetical protein
MAWSFASPDGRATFDLLTVDDQLRCRSSWVGDRAGFTRP